MSESHHPAFEIHSGIQLKGQLSMAKDILLTGKFEGDLLTLGTLTVASGGIAIGTIDAGGLVLQPGNLVEARVRVGAPPPSALKAAADAAKPKFGGWKRGIQRLKEFALGKS